MTEWKDPKISKPELGSFVWVWGKYGLYLAQYILGDRFLECDIEPIESTIESVDKWSEFITPEPPK